MILAVILATALQYKGLIQTSETAVELGSGIYQVQGNVTVKGTGGLSAIKVKEGATVVIYVPKDGTLTANGSSGTDAVGATPGSGAGAGIEVPSGAKLILAGEGAVTATAGESVGNSADGGKGADASYEEDADDPTDKTSFMTSGAGGNGGGGGGGGAAGIGGHGGAGGKGGTGAASKRVDYDVGRAAGVKGGSAEDCSSGGSAGTMVFLGRLTVTATATVSTGSVGRAGLRSNWLMVEPKSGYNYFMGFGGGGGGSGGTGKLADFDIGGGGRGGGGGGGGGSGGIFWDADADDLLNGAGDGLRGGLGLGYDLGDYGESWRDVQRKAFGETGKAWSKEVDEDYVGGSGGSGGRYRGDSEVGSVVKSSLTTLTEDTTVGATIQTAETDADAQLTISFADPDGKLTAVPADMMATVGMPLGEFTGAGTKSAEEVVLGWYAADDAAFETMIFDGNGQPVISCCNLFADVTLVPRIGSASEAATGVWIDGDRVGGPDGALSGDGWSYAFPVLTINDASQHTVWGTNCQGQVCLKLAGNAQVALDGLSLAADAKCEVPGVIAVEPGCAPVVELVRNVTIGTAVPGMAGIHCPAGASVRLWRAGDYGMRGYGIVEPTFEQAMAVSLPTNGTPRTTLVVSSGTGAAAIGGGADEICGDITLENCDLRTSPNGGVAGEGVRDIGNGVLGEGTDPRLGGRITFVRSPVVYSEVSNGEGVSTANFVSPRPHGERGIPLSAVTFDGRTLFVPPCNVGFLEGTNAVSFSTVGLGGVTFTGSLSDFKSLVSRLGTGRSDASRGGSALLAFQPAEVYILRNFASISNKKALTFLDANGQTMTSLRYGSYSPESGSAWEVTLKSEELVYLDDLFAKLYEQLVAL